MCHMCGVVLNKWDSTLCTAANSQSVLEKVCQASACTFSQMQVLRQCLPLRCQYSRFPRLQIQEQIPESRDGDSIFSIMCYCFSHPVSIQVLRCTQASIDLLGEYHNSLPAFPNLVCAQCSSVFLPPPIPHTAFINKAVSSHIWCTGWLEVTARIF